MKFSPRLRVVVRLDGSELAGQVWSQLLTEAEERGGLAAELSRAPAPLAQRVRHHDEARVPVDLAATLDGKGRACRIWCCCGRNRTWSGRRPPATSELPRPPQPESHGFRSSGARPMQKVPVGYGIGPTLTGGDVRRLPDIGYAGPMTGLDSWSRPSLGAKRAEAP